jgi:hypothetical protein
MSDREYHGKEEEKEYEKAEEKDRGAWGYEKWRRDPLSGIVWAGILIWAGVALLLSNMGLLSLRIGDNRVEPWSIVLMGAAVILLLEIVVRLIVPAYRRPIGGTLVFAAILFGIGLGDILGWSLVGPLVLIALGLSVLLRGFSGRR